MSYPKAYREFYLIIEIIERIGPSEALRRLQSEPGEIKQPDADLFGVAPSPKDNGKVLPDRWRNIPKLDRKNQRVLRNNSMMIRIGGWFNRRPTNLWTLAEGIALSEIHPDPEDVNILETYYLASIDKDQDFRRRDLQTLLNNWNGELDRARLWKAENE